MGMIKKTDEQNNCCNFFLMNNKNNINENVINKIQPSEKNCCDTMHPILRCTCIAVHTNRVMLIVTLREGIMGRIP